MLKKAQQNKGNLISRLFVAYDKTYWRQKRNKQEIYPGKRLHLLAWN